MTTHTLTEEQRRLLEGCPRERIEKFLSYNSNWPTLVVWASDGSNHCMPTSSTSGAYIPRAAVEAWLAEQEAKRKADEISPELRARLEKNLIWCLRCGGAFLRTDTVYLDKDGFPRFPWNSDISKCEQCTPAQARAFLREKGIEVTP